MHAPSVLAGVFGAGSIVVILAAMVLRQPRRMDAGKSSPDAPTKISRRPVIITSQDAKNEPPTLIMDRALLPIHPPSRPAPAPLPSVPDQPWLDIAIWVLVGLGCGALIALGFVHG